MKRCLPILAVLLLALPASAQLDRGFLSAAKRHRVGVVPVAAVAGTVTIDTSTAFASASGGVLSLTNAITVANNPNRVLYVGVGTGANSGADSVISVTSSVDGAFTEVGQASDGNWVNAQVWRLVSPTVGAHSVVIELAAPDQAAATTISLYTINTADPDDAASTANGTGTAPTASVTLATGEMAIGFLATDSGTGVSVTVGTQRQEVENVGTDTAHSLASNTGVGSTAITWATGNEGFAVVVVPVNATP